MPVVKLYRVETKVHSIGRIQMKEHLGLNTDVNLVPPPYEVNTGNRRMMTNLFSINRAPIDHPLIGLAQYRVKRLLNIKVDNRVTQREAYRQFYPLHNIRFLSGPLQKPRTQRHRLTEPLRVAILLENGDRQGDVEKGLATK